MDSKSLQDLLSTFPPPSFSCSTVVAVASVVAVVFALVVDDDDANDDEINDDVLIIEVGKKPGTGTARLGLCELSPIALLVDILDWNLALILPTAEEIPLVKLEEACREELLLDCPCIAVRNSLRKSPSSFSSSSSWEAVNPFLLPPSPDDIDPQLEVKLPRLSALLSMDWLLPLLQQMQLRCFEVTRLLQPLLQSSRILRCGSRGTGLGLADFLSLFDIPRPPSHKFPGRLDPEPRGSAFGVPATRFNSGATSFELDLHP